MFFHVHTHTHTPTTSMPMFTSAEWRVKEKLTDRLHDWQSDSALMDMLDPAGCQVNGATLGPDTEKDEETNNWEKKVKDKPEAVNRQ